MYRNIIIPLPCQCELFIQHVRLKIQLCLKIWFFTSFDIRWYAEAFIYPKNHLFSFYSFLVKFSEWHRGSVRVKLTKYDKAEWGENVIMQVTYVLNVPMFNLLFFCHFVLYWGKVTSYEKFSHNLTHEVQTVWKISAF